MGLRAPNFSALGMLRFVALAMHTCAEVCTAHACASSSLMSTPLGVLCWFEVTRMCILGTADPSAKGDFLRM